MPTDPVDKTEEDEAECNQQAASDQQQPPDTGGAPIKLFVGGIDPSWGITVEDLRTLFGKYGSIEEVVLKSPSNNGFRGQRGVSSSPRGYAFVSVADPEVAKTIVSMEHEINGHTIAPPMYAKSNYPRNGQTSRGSNHGKTSSKSTEYYGPVYDEAGSCLKVFIGGIGHDVTEESFRGFFEQFGTLTDCVIMHDFVTRRPRGFGFVAYAKRSSVDQLLQQQYYDLNGRRVEVKLAVPRERLANGEQDGNSAKYANGKSRAGARGGNAKHRNGTFQPSMPGFGAEESMDPNGYYMYGEQPVHGVVMPEYCMDNYQAEAVVSPAPYASMAPMSPMVTTGIPVQHGYDPVRPMAPAMMPPMTMAPAAQPIPTGKAMPMGRPPVPFVASSMMGMPMAPMGYPHAAMMPASMGTSPMFVPGGAMVMPRPMMVAPAGMMHHGPTALPPGMIPAEAQAA